LLLKEAGIVMPKAAKLVELAPALRHLIEKAARAREHAYAPYSHFQVGAAILTASGSIHVGCNVENGSYGATMCAERAAVAAAVSAGEREFAAIALVAASEHPPTPCGICRQVLAELSPAIEVVMANLAGDVLIASGNELLPSPFTLLR